jgi:uncharacterized Zn-finger protein
MDNHWAVITSSGRRVSLLCDDKPCYTTSHFNSSSPTPPPSPDYYHRPYAPFRAESVGSACSSSSLSTLSSQSLYTPRTPPNMCLPPLEKMLPAPESSFYRHSRKYSINSECSSPRSVVALPNTVSAASSVVDGSISPSATHASTASTPSSPKTSPNPTGVKRSSRRYTCQCGKSFTTSGHLARHTRIHTGEKNYVCPEVGCAARFSRQDNCMQHYRTHQSGGSSKRCSRKRRLSSDTTSSTATSTPRTPPVASLAAAVGSTAGSRQTQRSTPFIYPNYFESDGGLAALANVACSTYC